MNLVPDSFDPGQYLPESYSDEQLSFPTLTRAKVLERLRGGEIATGPTLPWQKTVDHFRMRPGEVTLWAGPTGQGKSMVTSQVALWLAKQGVPGVIASMEMKPESTMVRMVRQASGNYCPTEAWTSQFLEWANLNLWLIDQQGAVRPDYVIGKLMYCHKVMGVRWAIVDNLMKVISRTDDYSAQKAFVDALCTMARDTGMHIHLVAHTRKTADEYAIPDLWDVAGAAEIVGQVDNVWLVWRNKRKEEQLDQLRFKPDPAKERELRAKPDCVIRCAKQRHFEWEGKIGLWYLRDSNFYVEREGAVHPRPEFFAEAKADAAIPF